MLECFETSPSKITCKVTPRGIAADRLFQQHVVPLNTPYGNNYSIQQPRGMSQWLFMMIIALGRKRWDARGGAISKVATQ